MIISRSFGASNNFRVIEFSVVIEGEAEGSLL